MKLSFNTNGWSDLSWVDCYTMAADMEFSGIEIHDILSEDLSGKNRPFSSEQIVGTARKMRELGIVIPCIDLCCDIADESAFEANCADIDAAIGKAEMLGRPYIRLRAVTKAENDDSVIALMEKMLPVAEKAGVKLIIGLRRDVKKMTDLAEKFTAAAKGSPALAYYFVIDEPHISLVLPPL